MSARKETDNKSQNRTLRTLLGLFVIWLSFYLVALANDLSSRGHVRRSVQSDAAQEPPPQGEEP